MKRTLTFFLILLTCASAFSQTGVYPNVNQNHPRLWISQSRFNYLDSNKAMPPVNSFFNTFNYNYNNWWITVPEFYLTGNDSTQWTYEFRNFNSNESAYSRDMVYTGVYTGFLWKITHTDIHIKRTRFILRKFIIAVDTMSFQTLSGDNLESNLRAYGLIGSLLLDWCYNDIDSSIRNPLIRSLYKLNSKFYQSFIITSGGNSYVSSHNAYNCVMTEQNSICLYGDSALNQQQRDTVGIWFTTIYDKWINGFLPVYGYYRDDDGGWNWGAAYSFWSLTDQFILFNNFLTGTDKNFYQSHQWIINSINQYWYMVRPDNYCIHLGDGETFVTGDNVVYCHAKIYQDQRSRWLAQKYSSSPYLTSTNTYFHILAYKDFNAPVIQQPLLSTNWFSDKTGLFVSNSSQDSNAVQFWFYNALSKRASHEHRDNGSFAIYYRKPLLVDAGVYDSYGSSHFKNYYTRSIAHNTVCIFDSNEIFYYGTETVSNDGGQIYSNALMNYQDIFAPANQRGKWISHAAGNDYCFGSVDISLSYNPQKLTKYIRRFLYLKPDRFIILDNIILNNQNPGTSQREIRWTGHFMKEPQCSGILIENTVPGHITVFNGNLITTVNGTGKLTIKSMEPDSLMVRKIGGTGYEYYVNGINYAPTTNPDTLHNTPGKWRIEIIPTEYKDTNILINIMKTSDAISNVSLNALKILNSNSSGVLWDSSICLFNAKGDTGSVLHTTGPINIYGSYKIYVFDLKKNHPYTVKLDNQVISVLNSDSCGGIVSGIIIPLPGYHSLDISDNTAYIGLLNKNAFNYTLEQNYPNPFNPSTNIKFTAEETGYIRLTVFDLLGREISVITEGMFKPGTYDFLFDAGDLPAGVYFYQLKTDNCTETRKMLLIK